MLRSATSAHFGLFLSRLVTRQRPTSVRRSCIRPARVQIEGRHRPPPRALPVSGGWARVNDVIARTETSVAALNSSASNDLIYASVCFVRVVIVCSPASAACCTTSLQPLKSDCQSTAYTSAARLL